MPKQPFGKSMGKVRMTPPPGLICYCKLLGRPRIKERGEVLTPKHPMDILKWYQINFMTPPYNEDQNQKNANVVRM